MTVGMEKDLSWAAWALYTPTWTSAGTPPAIGNGTLYGRYRRIGTTGFANGIIQVGTTTTFGSANEWSLSLPPGWTGRTLANAVQFGQLLACPTGGGVFPGRVWVESAATVMRLVTDAPASITSAVPATWSAGATRYLAWHISGLELAA